jgi:hypothetical protein
VVANYISRTKSNKNTIEVAVGAQTTASKDPAQTCFLSCFVFMSQSPGEKLLVVRAQQLAERR